ncbi:MAG: molybdopterin-guanine dinucleotide biosynthesis protein MobB [Thioalkalispiraceae bacterium]|jgi:molybdopterin-guanine dinucleotide biosynthesis protein MobB
MVNINCPLLGFVAYSGTGKTTLLKQIIPLLKQKGIRVGMIKHAHHDFDIDKPGKDSYELRKAGADQMLVASSKRWALMVETPEQDEAHLDELLGNLATQKLDIILVEGFKHVDYPKIECHRPSLGHDLICSHDASIIAIATDVPLDVEVNIPRLDLNDPEKIVGFIMQKYDI